MRRRWRALAGLVLAAAVLVWFFAALGNLEQERGSQERCLLEDALRRAAAACYAVEGVYPPDSDYLAAHYGVQVDKSRFTVHYEIFADNLMPSITVLELP